MIRKAREAGYPMGRWHWFDFNFPAGVDEEAAAVAAGSPLPPGGRFLRGKMDGRNEGPTRVVLRHAVRSSVGTERQRDLKSMLPFVGCSYLSWGVDLDFSRRKKLR